LRRLVRLLRLLVLLRRLRCRIAKVDQIIYRFLARRAVIGMLGVLVM
jgi:hypothetical protein